MSIGAKGLRYVVLHHTGVESPHFDLMFETSPESALQTYRLPQWPIQEGDIATSLSAHRREYLGYEGPVSNDRGVVRRVAQGTIQITGTIEVGQNVQICLGASPTIWTLTPTDGNRVILSKLEDYD